MLYTSIVPFLVRELFSRLLLINESGDDNNLDNGAEEPRNGLVGERMGGGTFGVNRL